MSESKKMVCLGKHRKMACIVAVTLILLLIFLLIFKFGKNDKENTAKKEQSTAQQMTRIQKMDLATSISVTGTIASADSRSVSADVAGVEITKVHVAVGDYVSAGDTIVTLDSSLLEEDLASAKENYELAVTKSNKTLKDASDQTVEATETYTDELSEQASAVADALTKYSSAAGTENEKKDTYEKAVKSTEKAKKAYEEIKAKKSKLKKAMNEAQKANQSAQADLLKAQEDYEKEQMVGKDENGNIDETIYQTYQDAKQAAKEAEKKYQKAKEEYEKIDQAKVAYQDAKKIEEEALKAYQDATDETSEKHKDYEKALDTQADTNDKNAKQIEESKYNYSITAKETQSNLKSQKTQMQKAEEKLGECVVTAPISGVITSLSVEEGETYENGEMFVVQDMSAFIVEATVDEYDISNIAKEMEAVVKTDATGDEELTGVVTYVAPTPEAAGQTSMGGSSSGSATYKIQISLTDNSDKLRVGMTAKTSVVLSSAKDVLAVPYDYIQTEKDGTCYIEAVTDFNPRQMQQETMNTKKITVTKGIESDYYVEIVSDEISEGMMAVMSVSSNTEKSKESTDAQEGVLDNLLPGAAPGEMGPGNRGNSDRGNGNRGGGKPSGSGPGGF